MKLYRTGDLCPCCGQPIKLEDPQALWLFSAMMEMLGLPEAQEEEKEPPWSHRCGSCRAAGSRTRRPGQILCPISGQWRDLDEPCAFD